MRQRSDNVSRIEDEVEAMRTTITATEAESARQVELAAEAELDQRRSAEDAEAFADAARRSRAHADEHRRLGFVAESRRQDLTRLERELAEARYGHERQAVEASSEQVRKASAEFATRVAAAIDALPRVSAVRDQLDATVARGRELANIAGDELTLPASADEAEYPVGVDRLIEALRAGPRRPHASSAAARETMRRDSDRAARRRASEALRDVFREGDFSKMRSVAPSCSPRRCENSSNSSGASSTTRRQRRL